MKIFFLLFISLLSQLGLCQVAELEAKLKVAEEELLTIEQERNELKSELFAAGEVAANNPDLIALNDEFKTKKKEIKTLRKQYKQAVKDSNSPVPTDADSKINGNAKDVKSNKNIVETEQARELPVIGLSTILFGKFETTIAPEYELYINYVVKQMQEDESLQLSIHAFTDNSEKGKIAKELTEKMASAVAKEFIRRGIPNTRLLLSAHGSGKSIANNDTFLGQARNRRVELRFQ